MVASRRCGLSEASLGLMRKMANSGGRKALKKVHPPVHPIASNLSPFDRTVGMFRKRKVDFSIEKSY
jgi:hypothetical protein